MNEAQRLQRTLEQLFGDQPDDSRLRDHLEGLKRDEHLPGLTWFWGPILYRRNRVTFRPFILNHFSDWSRTSRTAWSRVAWSAHAKELEDWLKAARTSRDVQLVRRLYRWKFAAKRWGVDSKQWSVAMLAAYRAAATAAERASVLDEFDDWFELDEDTALALYQTDRASANFIVKHLQSGFWTTEKRKLWPRLLAAARTAKDEKFEFTVYRKVVPIDQWQKDVLQLAATITDVSRLNDELTNRHAEGYGVDYVQTFVRLLMARGRDVMPYIRSVLPKSFGFFVKKIDSLVALAKERGWWDLWSATIRIGGDEKLFNRSVEELLDDTKLPETERLGRLAALAGVSREWNWPGFGFARVHTLNDEVGTRLYETYPHLIHGPFKPHMLPTWWQDYSRLLKSAQNASDEELVDLMASRYVTRVRYDYAWSPKQIDKVLETADALADDFQELRDRDPIEFARRAANVLTRVPAYSIHGYSQLLRTNKLARLLFVRSFEAYLSVPEAVRDLVEGSDIHVQHLAYRVLAQEDPRATQLAAEMLDILIGTLLRPLHRKTRIAAFAALANAARANIDAAKLVLQRTRDALRLPDRKYPKEELVGMIGQVLHVQPSLRGPRERPVVYGLEEVAV